LNKLIPLLAFSILLLVPAGTQNAFAVPSVPAGFSVSNFASGLDEPVGLAFDSSGNLFAVNSKSFFSVTFPIPDSNIIKITPGGIQSIFVSGLKGPGYVAIDAADNVWVSIEDGDEAGVAEDIQKYDSSGSFVTSITTITGMNGLEAISEPGSVRIAQGGFGSDPDIFFTTRDGVAPNPDGPYRVFDSSTSPPSIFPISIPPEVTGSFVFNFGPGGSSSFGSDLYVETFDDVDSIDPNAINAIYRVTPAGSATLLTTSSALDLAINPSTSNAFGDFLYFTSGADLNKMDSSGIVTTFATGLTAALGLAFGPDGNLYLGDGLTGDIWKIEPLDIDTDTGQVIGGEIISIETTSLLLASAQSSSWMIPVVLSVLGIGLFVVSRKSENS